MNQGLIRLIVLGAGLLLIGLIDVSLVKQINWLSQLFHPSVFILAIVTARLGWWPGVLTAGLFGWLYRLFSTLPGFIHPLAFLIVVVSMSLSSRRILANRSTVSFLSLILIGTVAHALAIWLGVEVTRWLQIVPDASGLQTPTWPWLQWIVHPVLAWVWWQASGRTRRYATANLTTEQSF